MMPTGALREVLDRIERVAAVAGGVAAVDPDRVMREAEAAERRLREGRGRPLEGVPITVKDWIDVAGLPVTGATGGHRGEPGRVPGTDATAVARLRAAGCVVVAITSALAGNALHGVTRNPRDLTRAPGGSSSGAAALVAAGAVPLALGSDSGGSIRLPAAWCGVAGLKPTFGRVPLTGHFPRCGALEDGRTVIGLLAADVAGLVTVLRIIAGPDGLDAGAVPVPLADPAAVDLRSLRVGVMAGGMDEPVDRAVRTLVAAGAGASARLPDVRSEALDISRRKWGRGSLDGKENERLLWDWDRFRRRLLVATGDVDVLITPAAGPAPPWRESGESDYLWTLPWSLTGAPAVVVPIDTGDPIPATVQVIARPWQDHVALAVAAALETRVPPAEPGRG